MFDDVMERITTSWHQSEASLAARIKAGTQPEAVMLGTNFETLVVANSVYLAVIALLYFWMSRRENDFKVALKPVIIVYNAMCVFFAGYVVYGIIDFKLRNPDDLHFVCNDGARTGPFGDRLGWIFWVFYAQKFWEFCDTWFFILRKNFNQVSVLHVYHHASITVVVGMLMRHQFTGDVYLPIFLNSVIHVLMYSHYLVTALGIRSWWSQYLTSMQLIQFLLIGYQSAYAWYQGPQCGAQDWGKVMLVAYMGTMLVLFGDFFVKKYLKGSTGKKGKSAEGKKQK